MNKYDLEERLIDCVSFSEWTQLYKFEEKIIEAKKEINELISIFVVSIKTAQKNNKPNLKSQIVNQNSVI